MPVFKQLQQRERERERDPRFYQPPRQQLEPLPPLKTPRQQQHYPRSSYYEDFSLYNQQRDDPVPLTYGQGRTESQSRYSAQPLPPIDTRMRPTYGGPQPRRSVRDYNNEYQSPVESGGGRRGEDGLFPASRYAAPFLRDYELQQREGRRRMPQGPPMPMQMPMPMPVPAPVPRNEYGSGGMY
ncbi:hypothetical protein BC939DRAFT_462038 [Gamsiella multidivaricata]|uniref:uncharacterized protein n=1 Tax=Gamsiella multidivaricata TaxID=101098 RepID=UPI00221F8F82|nr:uncharacterized protein BC939DRAFT_462038 [Gamsiella multidivaricata]KAI7818801.1 hypothetical protein BC939DRAFT_462038 [Gamsiella multidivaricata]